jgi:hypothetical protein
MVEDLEVEVTVNNLEMMRLIDDGLVAVYIWVPEYVDT